MKFKLVEEKESNQLKKMANWSKKRQKGLGAFVKLDAGNVPYNNAMFNKMSNASESPSVNPTGPMGESIENDD